VVSPSVEIRTPGWRGEYQSRIKAQLGIAVVVSGLVFGLTSPAAPVETKPTAWKVNLSVAIKEAYDNNVYLQSETPLADQASFVTSLLPQLGLGLQPDPAFGVSLNYTPEIVFFHSESSEDYLAQRAQFSLSGKLGNTKYEARTSLVFIDGSSTSPTWTGPGGAPATGGPAVRDRRDAAVYRSSFLVTQNLGRWFVRPSVSFYLHDFQTDQRATAGYQNYVDRDEVVLGLDLGVPATKNASVWVGYRYGIQDQAKLLTFPEEYDNTFHRALLGVDGELAKWCKVAISIGPEFRRYGDKVPMSFGDRSGTIFCIDASTTLSPTTNDTVTLSVKRFEQPGFGGRSTYDDLTYDLGWKHKFGSAWTVGIGGRAYNTDFLAPIVRNDWVLSGNALVNYTLAARWNAEMSYVYERGLTRTANASGREYERHLIALGIKYTFH